MTIPLSNPTRFFAEANEIQNGLGLPQKYQAIYQALQENIEAVLQNYARPKVAQRVNQFQARVTAWEQKYGCEYASFVSRVADDEPFVEALNGDVETMMWESDLIEWEADIRLHDQWVNHLKQLSQP